MPAAPRRRPMSSIRASSSARRRCRKTSGASPRRSRRNLPTRRLSMNRASRTSTRMSGSKRHGPSARHCVTDPNCAMAWMGLARAEQGLERDVAARAAIDRAKALAPGAHGPRAPVHRAARGADGRGSGGRHRPRKRAGTPPTSNDRRRPRRLPGRRGAVDPTGQRRGAGARGRGQRGGVGSIAFYEAALRRAPGHFAAEHYLVHSFENVGQHADAGKERKALRRGGARRRARPAHVRARPSAPRPVGGGARSSSRRRTRSSSATPAKSACAPATTGITSTTSSCSPSPTCASAGSRTPKHPAPRLRDADPDRDAAVAARVSARVPPPAGTGGGSLQAAQKIEAGSVSAGRPAPPSAGGPARAGRRADAEDASRVARQALEEGRATLKGSPPSLLRAFRRAVRAAGGGRRSRSRVRIPPPASGRSSRCPTPWRPTRVSTPGARGFSGSSGSPRKPAGGAARAWRQTSRRR